MESEYSRLYSAFLVLADRFGKFYSDLRDFKCLDYFFCLIQTEAG